MTSYVDRSSILLVVYAAFSESVVQGVWTHMDYGSLLTIFGLDVLLLAAVLAITTLVSRWFAFSTEDEIRHRVLRLEESMASGVPMANILFPGRRSAPSCCR